MEVGERGMFERYGYRGGTEEDDFFRVGLDGLDVGG